MHALTNAELQTLLLTVNAVRKKRGENQFRLDDVEDFLSGIHAAALVIIQKGTLLEFERYSHIVWKTIKRYKEAGLL